MSDKKIYVLAHPEARRRAMAHVAEAPIGYHVTIKEPTRSLEMNDKFHAICSDLDRSRLAWGGKSRTQAEWKVLLISGHAHATKEGFEIIGGIEGELVNVRESTALMSVKRGSSLIEYSLAFCALHEVELGEAEEA